MAIVKISDLPMVDEPVQGTDLFVVVQDNVTKKAFASDIQTYVGFEEVQTATAGQTVFNLTQITYAAGANNLQVFVDGVNQYEGSSYTETDNNTVTFSQGLHEGALVKFSTVQTQTSLVNNAGAVVYNPAGTGAVPTNVQAKLRETVSVKDFGAVGDGVTDDTAAINLAIAAATLAGAELVFPAGTYKHTSALTFTCNVQGHGMPRIMSVGDIKSVVVTNFYGYFKGIKIEPDGTGSTGNDGLTIAGGARTIFENIYVTGCGNDGIVFDSTTRSNNIASLNNVQSRLNGRDGIRLEIGLDNNACLFSNVDVSSNTDNGLTLTGVCVGTVLNNVVAQNNGVYGIAYLGANCRNNIGTAYVETNTTADVYFDVDAHTNMLWLSNDGAALIDSNGTNTILSAGSGSTQRYNFNSVDFTKLRIYDKVNIGQLEASQTGARSFAFTALGSSSSFLLSILKGAASAISLFVEGWIVSADRMSVSNPTNTSAWPSISAGSGSPEGVVTARVGSLYQRSDGGAGTSIYVKESGTGSTGWVAK